MGKFNRGGDRRDFGGGRDRNRGFGGNDRGPRQMFQATCSECGNDCEIPFKPRDGRPVFCSSCFENQGNSSGFNRPDRRDNNRPSFGGDKRMFPAVCDTCGQSCEVPFRPTGEKPVYCNQCFGKNGNKNARKPEPSLDQFSKLNSKLDKIIELLGSKISVEPKTIEKKAKKVDKIEVVKNPEPKVKAEKKKAKSKKKK